VAAACSYRERCHYSLSKLREKGGRRGRGGERREWRGGRRREGYMAMCAALLNSSIYL